MLEGLREQLAASPVRIGLVLAAVAAIFICAGIYVYKTQVAGRLAPTYVPNKEFAPKGGGEKDGVADMYFFYTTWCPHCKTARPAWDEFKAEMDGRKVNGTKIKFTEIDCDKDSATADRYNVKGYPTIKLVHKGEVIEFDAKPQVASLHQFVKTSL
jgi:thiol-disulfide isomerase/thioredoxin